MLNDSTSSGLLCVDSDGKGILTRNRRPEAVTARLRRRGAP